MSTPPPGPPPSPLSRGGDDSTPRGDAFSKAPITLDTPDDEAERWHRLHPLTPFLRGGWFVLAVFGWVISQQWQRLTNLLIPDQWQYDDPTFAFINDPVRLLMVLGGTVLVALVIVLVSYVAWRAHSYRLTADLFEVRSGIVTKKHRQARLDRVQSIDINRPVIARIFGAAAVVLDTASADGKIDLKYVRSAHAEPLREAILRRASGARRRATEASGSETHDRAVGASAGDVPWATGQGLPGASPMSAGAVAGAASVAQTPEGGMAPNGAPAFSGSPIGSGTGPLVPGDGAAVIGGPSSEGRLATLVRARIDDFTDLQRDTRDAEPQSIVSIRPGRLFGVAAIDIASVAIWFVLIGGTAALAALIASSLAGVDVAEALAVQLLIFGGFLVPLVIVGVTVVGSRIFGNFNYSIVGTPNGVRMSKGFPSTKSETVPPGRIHAIEIRQPMFWRPFGWWEVRITRAGQKVDSSAGSGQNAAAQSVLLPVGRIDDVRRVLDLVTPDQTSPERSAIIDAGMIGTPGDVFTAGPTRGRWLHPVAFRRIGYVLTDDTFFIRRGRVGRKLMIVPGERMQSIAVIQGPLLRWLRLAKVQAQTVQGVVNTMLPNLDHGHAVELFDRLRQTAIRAATSDSSHRWSEAAARSAIAAARMRVSDARAQGLEATPVDLAVLDASAAYEREQISAPGAVTGTRPSWGGSLGVQPAATVDPGATPADPG